MFTPYFDDQILLPDTANCRAIETFFKMAGIDYLKEQRVNAEFMAPHGKVPLIACGSFLISDLDRISSFFKEKGQGIGDVSYVYYVGI